MADSFIFGSIETLINQAIKLDPIAAHRLGSLSNKSLSIQTSSPTLRMTIYFIDNQILIHNRIDPSANALLTGSVPALLRQAGSGGDFSIGGPLEISGELELVQQIHTIARDLDMDWEEPIAKVLGDPIAHKIGRLGRGFFAWSKSAASNAINNTVDLLQMDQQGFAEHAELNRFNDNVDTLKMDLDRLDAKIDRLENK